MSSYEYIRSTSLHLFEIKEKVLLTFYTPGHLYRNSLMKFSRIPQRRANTRRYIRHENILSALYRNHGPLFDLRHCNANIQIEIK